MSSDASYFNIEIVLFPFPFRLLFHDIVKFCQRNFSRLIAAINSDNKWTEQTQFYRREELCRVIVNDGERNGDEGLAQHDKACSGRRPSETTW